jgi:hypothetical protein
MAVNTAPWSDGAGLFFLTAGIALFVRGQALSTELEKNACAVSAVGGALFVLGCCVRYANIIGLLPLGVYLIIDQRSRIIRAPRNWAFGGIVALGFLAILAFNRDYYGGFFTTGYSPRHGWYDWAPFSLHYALGQSPVGEKSLVAALWLLYENFRWLILPGMIGVLAIPGAKRTIVAGWIAGFVLLYGLYAFPATGVNARFLLPAFPMVAVAVAYGLGEGARRWGWEDRKGQLWTALGIGLLLMAMLLPLPERLDALRERNTAAQEHVAAIKSAVEASSEDAVFLSYNWNDPIFYYGDRLAFYYRRIPSLDLDTGEYSRRRWESVLVKAVNELLKRQLPVYYVQDADPPFLDSLNLLSRHFLLSRATDMHLPVYRIYREPATR